MNNTSSCHLPGDLEYVKHVRNMASQDYSKLPVGNIYSKASQDTQVPSWLYKASQDCSKLPVGYTSCKGLHPNSSCGCQSAEVPSVLFHVKVLFCKCEVFVTRRSPMVLQCRSNNAPLTHLVRISEVLSSPRIFKIRKCFAATRS